MRTMISTLSVACMLSLTACGGGQADTSTPTSTDVVSPSEPSPGTDTGDTTTEVPAKPEPTEPAAPPASDPATSAVPAVTGVQLVGYVSASGYTPLKDIADGDTLVLAEMPETFNIEAISEDASNTGSVKLVLEGPQRLNRLDNATSYTIAAPSENLSLASQDLPVGSYVLWATPYSGPDGTGEAGATFSTTFVVSEKAPITDEPTISAVQLVEYVSADEYRPIRTLADGDNLVLSNMPQLINLEALVADAEKVGSVDFVLEGPKTVERMDTAAIYTVADSYYNFDVSAGGLPAGEYTLYATPYAGADLTGEQGDIFSVTFTVTEDEVAEKPIAVVPPVTSVQIVEYIAANEYEPVAQIVDGDAILLDDMPTIINIEAVSEDVSATGSVKFVLEGPRSISRFENTAIYTLADGYYNMDLMADGLPEGHYTLTVTPYSGPDASGTAGTTLRTRFSVKGHTAPAANPPVANDDAYYGKQNQSLAIDQASGVKSNDTADAIDSAEVQLTSQPSYGTLSLSSDGSFSYKPDDQFNGIDSFDYVLVDANGSESYATVTLSITSADADNNGFTPIVPSDDTRTVYVSSSEGMDSNSGLSIGAPVKTLNKAFSLVRNGYPDHVLLKRGDLWVDENLSGVKSGRSVTEPAVVAFYGQSGGRPRLKTSGTSLSSGELYYVNIMGLEIEAYKLNPADPAFDGSTSANIRMVGDFKNILFEDMKFRFVEFVVQGYDNKKPRDFHIRRSMILDKYSPGTSYSRDSRPSGIYTDNGEGLIIEDNVWDHNGWNAEVVGAAANMFNHNMYISERNNVGNKIVIRNNIVTRGSALGIHGRPGGLYENNFFARNAIGLQMGYNGGDALAASTFAYARNNVITEGLNMARGIDACSGDNLCTKAIWGLQVENLGSADVRVEGNIVSSRLFEHEGHVKGIREDAQAKYSDNIVYRWDSADQGMDQNYPDPGRTVADYNAHLGGERSFEAFIKTVRNRGLQEWDERYSADAVNDYIRAGFGR